MSEPARDTARDTAPAARIDPGASTPRTTPRWVRVAWSITVVVVVVLVIVLVTKGPHRPGGGPTSLGNTGPRPPLSVSAGSTSSAHPQASGWAVR